jgi:AcrR family transcriptional regulator
MSNDPIRQQLIEARRNQLLDAAATVFSEKGFHQATTKEIAHEAGVSEGTIYNYFDSKGDLLIGLMTRLAKLDALAGELNGALQLDPRDFFIDILRRRPGRIEQLEETVLAVLPEVLVSPDLRERFYQQFVRQATAMIEQYVRARIEMGDIRPVDATLTARALQGMFVGLLIFRILGDEAIISRWDDLPEVLTSMLFDGLGVTEEA